MRQSGGDGGVGGGQRVPLSCNGCIAAVLCVRSVEGRTGVRVGTREVGSGGVFYSGNWLRVWTGEQVRHFDASFGGWGRRGLGGTGVLHLYGGEGAGSAQRRLGSPPGSKSIAEAELLQLTRVDEGAQIYAHSVT